MPALDLKTGATINYEEAGSGMPLVLLYGAGGDHTCWRPQVDALSARYRLLMPDLRGTGKSAAPIGDWSLATYAEDVAALMDELEIAAAHVVGMSMGTAVAQELLLARPDLVAASVMMNGWGRTDARLRALWGHMGFLNELAAHAGDDPDLDPKRHERDLVELNLALFFSPWTLQNDRALAESWWEVYVGGMQAEGAVAHFASIQRHDVLGRASEIAAPVLVLAGEEDYFTPHYSRELAAALPNSTFKLLEGPRAAHGMHWERPDEVNAEVLGFLAGHDR